jgi:hypothetical protein
LCRPQTGDIEITSLLVLMVRMAMGMRMGMYNSVMGMAMSMY